MYETDNDIRRLQELLDRTMARANPHLRSLVSPERLPALQVVTYLQGTKHVACMVIEPRSMWAYAFHPKELPE